MKFLLFIPFSILFPCLMKNKKRIPKGKAIIAPTKTIAIHTKIKLPQPNDATASAKSQLASAAAI